MSYADSLERLKKLQNRPSRVVTKGSKEAFVTSDTASPPLFQKTQPSQGASDQSDDLLHESPAQASENLLSDVPDLLETFVEKDRGDCIQGSEPHHKPEYQPASKPAVADRLKDDRRMFEKHAGGAVVKGPSGGFETYGTSRVAHLEKSRPQDVPVSLPRLNSDSPTDLGQSPQKNEGGDFQKGLGRAVTEVPKAPKPLDGQTPLREDGRFIDRRTDGRQNPEQPLQEHAGRQEDVLAAEPVEFETQTPAAGLRTGGCGRRTDGQVEKASQPPEALKTRSAEADTLANPASREQTAGDPVTAPHAMVERGSRPSLRRAIDRMCRDCCHDPKSGLGTWRQQTEACGITRCPLWPVRPVSKSKGV
jgi:hypothetical protein